MISLSFAVAVPVLEPHGRSKNLVHRVSTEALGGHAAMRISRLGRGWLVEQEQPKVSDAMKIPATWVPDENVTSVEGTVDEVRDMVLGTSPFVVAAINELASGAGAAITETPPAKPTTKKRAAKP